MEEKGLYYSFLCISLLLVAITFLLQPRKQRKNLPPGPPALPIIGHIHLLKQPIHKTLHNLSQKYGPIISLRLASRPMIVVSSQAAVEECFTKNDIIFANRPSFLHGKYLNYNNTTVAASNYGDHWRNLRRICTVEILSSSRLNSLADVRRDEVNNLVQRLDRVSNHGFAKVELRTMLSELTFNIIMRMVAGKRYYGEDLNGDIKEAEEFRDIINKFSEYAAVTNLGDLFPIMQWIDYDGFVKKLVTLSKRMDSFLQRLLEEHRGVDKGKNTMITHLLTLQESQPEYYTDQIIKGLILIMVLAGTRTSSTAMEWAITNLLNHPEVLKKAKEELDAQIGEDRLANEQDFSKLHYLQCFILENFRMCPVAPLLTPHMSSKDTTVGGYDVPRGTMLFVNAWAIHRDPQLWDDPASFKPERFENGKCEAFKLMPFGLGRRACPGEGMAIKVMTLTLSSLIQCFEWQRIGDKEIDMTANIATVMIKAEPLEVMCRARPNIHKLLI